MKLSQEQFDSNLNMAIALLAQCSASINLDSALDMVAGGDDVSFGGYGTTPETITAHLEHWDIAEQVSEATQTIQKNVDFKLLINDNDA